MTEQDLDKLFKNTLENASVDPPVGVWEAVSASTASSTVAATSVTIVKWVAATLIAASAITAVYLSTDSSSKVNLSEQVENTILNVAKDSSVASDEVSSELNKAIQNKTEELNPSNSGINNTDNEVINGLNPLIVEETTVNDKPITFDNATPDKTYYEEVPKQGEAPAKKSVICPKMLTIVSTKTDFNTYRFEVLNTSSLITWYYGDGAVSNGSEGFHLYPSVSKNYTVLAVGKNLSGCLDTGKIQVQAEASKPVLFVPDYFTPNGDGTNDEFYITIENSKAIDYFDLIVFDSRNRPVFRSTNPADRWDGKCGAIECGVGTYKMVVSYRLTGTSKIVTQKNSLLLNR